MSISMTDHDKDGNLKNFSYDYCTNNSETELKSCRGLVYKNEVPFIKSFGFTPHYTTQDIPQDTLDYIQTNFTNFRFFYSLEGTLLRLFYNDVNDKWYLSTHKKLDATNSRWGSKYTFGEIFKSSVPDSFDYNKLDKDKFYMFILTPNDTNRIVCKTFLNQVYHVGTYDKNFNLSYDYDIGVQKPSEVNFNNINEMIKFVDNNVGYFLYQGIVICDPVSQTNIKILSSNYNTLQQIRGNTPSVKFRYLEIRKDEEKVKQLKALFPDFVNDFSEYEEYIDKFANKMLGEYIQRYIKKNFKQLLPNEHYILKLAHAWHNENRNLNKINIDKIKEIINKQVPSFLNVVVKSYKQIS